MTLDQRIEKDLSDLYNYGEMIDSHILSRHIFHVNDSFSAYGIPQHFVGDRNAKTVMVMLNPGTDVGKANNVIQNYDLINKLGINTTNLKSFIDTYKIGYTNYGCIDKKRSDAFDIKTALFLKDWENSCIKIPNDFPNDKGTYLKAKENTLMQKLQLELVPYASRHFNIDKKDINYLVPYLETLSEEIVRTKRDYVIFCSIFFKTLFANNSFLSVMGIKINKWKEHSCPKQNFNCISIEFEFKGLKQDALIANTFYNRTFKYSEMRQYGKFCYDNYGNYNNTII